MRDGCDCSPYEHHRDGHQDASDGDKYQQVCGEHVRENLVAKGEVAAEADEDVD